MAKVVYQVVEHDGGWAYTSNGVFSKTFPSHEAARAAAGPRRRRTKSAGPDRGDPIRGRPGPGWHNETAKGDDRPITEVVDRKL